MQGKFPVFLFSGKDTFLSTPNHLSLHLYAEKYTQLLDFYFSPVVLTNSITLGGGKATKCTKNLWLIIVICLREHHTFWLTKHLTGAQQTS